MLEQEPTERLEWSGQLDEEEDASEDTHEIHEVQRLIISRRRNQVVCVGLVINGTSAADDKVRVEEVIYEVAASMVETPDVEVADRIHTFVIVEYCLAVPADEEHSNYGQDHCNGSMNRTQGPSAVFSSLHRSHLLIDSNLSHGK